MKRLISSALSGQRFSKKTVRFSGLTAVLLLALSFSSSQAQDSATITGRVTDPSGAPAAGMRVSSWPLRGSSVQTDSNGNFSLSWVPTSGNPAYNPIFAVVRDDSRNLVATKEIDPSMPSVDLSLQPGTTLAVRVRDTNGRPIAGATATVRLETASSQLSVAQAVPAGTNGEIELKNLPAGKGYDVEVLAGGFIGASLHAEPRETIVGRLEFPPLTMATASLAIAGQLIGADGQPASGIGVALSKPGSPNTTVITGNDGRFRFDQLPAGEASLLLRYNGLPLNRPVTAGDTNVVFWLGEIGSRRGNRGINMPSNPGQTNRILLTGRITDPDGVAAPGVAIRIWPNVAGVVRESTGTTDSQGRYTLVWTPSQSVIEPGNLPGLLARDAGRDLAAVAVIDLKNINQDIKLKPTLVISGAIQDEAGQPVPAAKLQIIFYIGYFGSAPDRSAMAVDATTGTFEIRGLAQGGRYQLSVTADSYSRANLELKSADTQKDTLKLDPFILKRGTLPFAGRVLDENGNAVSGAQIIISGRGQPVSAVRTDSRGHFETKVAGGIFTAQAALQGRITPWARAEGGETDHVFQFAAPYIPPPTVLMTITGTVTDPQGGPAAGVSVIFWPPAWRNEGPDVLTDATGRYSMQWVAPQTKPPPSALSPRLLARDTAHNLVAIEDIDNQTTTRNIRLQFGATISGVVMDEHGLANGATITAASFIGTNQLSLDTRSVQSDEHGAFQLAALFRGVRLDVSAAAPGHAYALRQMSAEELSAKTITLPTMMLPAINADLAGVVLSEDAQPVPDATVFLISPRLPGNRQFHTDDQGRFKLRTSDGPASLRVDFQRKSATLQVESGDTNIVIRFGGVQTAAAGNGLHPVATAASSLQIGGPEPEVGTVALPKRWPALHLCAKIIFFASVALVLGMVIRGFFRSTRRTKT